MCGNLIDFGRKVVGVTDSPQPLNKKLVPTWLRMRLNFQLCCMLKEGATLKGPEFSGKALKNMHTFRHAHAQMLCLAEARTQRPCRTVSLKCHVGCVQEKEMNQHICDWQPDTQCAVVHGVILIKIFVISKISAVIAIKNAPPLFVIYLQAPWHRNCLFIPH